VIRQALILAGGKGTRLDPLGDYLPKCLATVYNRPLVDFQLRLLASAGVEDVYLSVSARHCAVVQESVRCLMSSVEAIPDGGGAAGAPGRGERLPRVHLLDERTPAGVQALFEAGARLPAEPFWFMLGDLYYGARRLEPATLPAGVDAVLHTRRYDVPASIARETSNVVVDGERVVAVRDKPRSDEIEGDLGWYATALIAPAFLARREAILDWLERRGRQAHVGDLFEAAVQVGAVVKASPGGGGAWINVNTPDQLMEASRIEQQRLGVLEDG
jgi:NDP-sugar pyrophosphorylase family protein